MFQRWLDLLFMHWPIPPEFLERLIPEPLELETFGGEAWLGLTPFRLAALRPRFLPPVPLLSSFPEMNLRTYVRLNGRSGIYFFTLEAGSRLAVLAARRFYGLPYHYARMEVNNENDWIRYSSVRPDGAAMFRGRYRPVGPVRESREGSLEHFLTERYALYVVLGKGRVLIGEIHHRPWQLQSARAEIDENALPRDHGIELARCEPLLLYAARQDTLVWSPDIRVM